MKKKTISKTIGTILKLIVLIIIMIFLVGPFIIFLSNSFKFDSEINQIVPTLIPRNFTMGNYNELFSDDTFFKNMINSLYIALITMIFSTVIAIPAAYAIARIRSKSTQRLQIWIILSQMVPGISIIVPLFLILNTMHLTDTHPGIIVIYVVFSLPFSIWMLSGFIKGIPHELEEAAFIDGCSMWKMFNRILFPAILPGLVTAGVFTFINAWNEFFFALCFLSTPELLTLPAKINSFVGQGGQARLGMLSASSVIATIPGLIIFMVFQRFFVKGLTAGSIK